MSRMIWLTTLLLIASCSSLPIGSLHRLSQFDPMTADLYALRIEVEIPRGLSVLPGSATLTLQATPENAAPIRHRAEFTQPAPSRAPSRPGYHRLAFALAADDAAAFDAVRQKISTLKAAGHRISGSLSVDAAPCATDEIPDGPLLLSIWLDTGNGDPIALQLDRDLRQFADDTPGLMHPDTCVSH